MNFLLSMIVFLISGALIPVTINSMLADEHIAIFDNIRSTIQNTKNSVNAHSVQFLHGKACEIHDALTAIPHVCKQEKVNRVGETLLIGTGIAIGAAGILLLQRATPYVAATVYLLIEKVQAPGH